MTPLSRRRSDPLSEKTTSAVVPHHHEYVNNVCVYCGYGTTAPNTYKPTREPVRNPMLVINLYLTEPLTPAQVEEVHGAACDALRHATAKITVSSARQVDADA